MKTSYPDRNNRYFISGYHAPTAGTEYSDLDSITLEAQELANNSHQTIKVWEYPFAYQINPQPVLLFQPNAAAQKGE